MRYLPPSIHLQRRFVQQVAKALPAQAGSRLNALVRGTNIVPKS